MPLPTFLIAGAQKCGTSSLAAVLREHPQVHMPLPKEHHFFDRSYDQGLSTYADAFRPEPQHRQWGEATPVYIYDPEARARMVAAVPEARYIVMLRDPTKRAYSHFWHSRRKGLDTVETFEEALDLESERLAAGTTMALARYSYVDRGHYLGQLRALTDAVGREQVLVELMEDMVADPPATLTRVFEHLGIDAGPAAELELEHRNRYRVEKPDGAVQAAEYPRMAEDTRARLVEHFAPHNDALGEWLGRDLRTVWQFPPDTASPADS